ncbi:MAG: hypothetical protein FJ038_12675 [Chloroflexi bacterium]|nr:hypothetical protein [Chloroflexota bacterium]
MPAATESAGVTPVEASATPAQSDDQTTPTALSAEPVTGEGDGLKRALDAERAQRRELEKALRAERAQREALETSALSDHEKAIAQARKDAAADATTKAHAMVRRAEVRRALQASGVTADALDLAAGAPEFTALAVDDDGSVTDLDRAVEGFRKAHPSLFAAARVTAGNFDGGSGGAPAAQSWSRDQIGAMSQAEFEKNEAEIMRAMREGRIRD